MKWWLFAAKVYFIDRKQFSCISQSREKIQLITRFVKRFEKYAPLYVIFFFFPQLCKLCAQSQIMPFHIHALFWKPCRGNVDAALSQRADLNYLVDLRALIPIKTYLSDILLHPSKHNSSIFLHCWAKILYIEREQSQFCSRLEAE